MNLLDYTDTVISTRQIDLILAFYELSRSLEGGKEMRKKIESKVDYINPYSTRVSSFRELVEIYDHETSPLRQLLVSNGWLVIQDNQKLPWTFEEFLLLFRRTQFRGLRILPSLLPNGKSSIQEDIVLNGIENMRFAIIRDQGEFTIVFYQKEYYAESRGEGYGDIEFFSNSSERIKLNYTDAQNKLEKRKVKLESGIYPLHEASFGAMKIISRFFDADASWPNYSLIFSPLVWNRILDLYYEKQKDLLVMEDLTDNGELSVAREGRRGEDLRLSYLIVSKLKRFVELTYYFYEKNTFPYGDANLDKRQQGSMPDSATKEETYSFYAYDDSLFNNPIRDTKILRFESMEEITYGCYDTGSGRICLVAEEELESGEEFEVLSVREDVDLFFHSIRLR